MSIYIRIRKTSVEKSDKLKKLPDEVKEAITSMQQALKKMESISFATNDFGKINIISPRNKMPKKAKLIIKNFLKNEEVRLLNEFCRHNYL